MPCLVCTSAYAAMVNHEGDRRKASPPLLAVDAGVSECPRAAQPHSSPDEPPASAFFRLEFVKTRYGHSKGTIAYQRQALVVEQQGKCQICGGGGKLLPQWEQGVVAEDRREHNTAPRRVQHGRAPSTNVPCTSRGACFPSPLQHFMPHDYLVGMHN